MKSSKSTRILGMTKAQIIFLSISGLLACGILSLTGSLVFRTSPATQANSLAGSTALPTVPVPVRTETASPVPTAPPTLTPSPIPASPTPIPTATQPPTPSAKAGSAAGLLYITGEYGCEIRWINVRDGSTKHVGNIPLNLCGGQNNQKAWAPDGKQFALVTSTGDPGNALFSIQILKQDGSAVYQLISGHGMIGSEGLYWSPDGQRLAYILYDYDADLFFLNVVYVDGRDHSHGNFLILTEPDLNLVPSAGGTYVSWAPDGQHLVANAVNETGKNGLYVIFSQENIVELLKGTPIMTSKPRWSPDGKNILYNDDFYSWKIIALDGDRWPQPFIDSGTFLAWAPDSSEAFALTHPENGPAQLIAYAGDGSQKPRVIASQNVPNLQGWNPNALWSPDKKMLVFWGLNQDQAYLLDLETGTVKTLKMSVKTEESFVWYSPGN